MGVSWRNERKAPNSSQAQSSGGSVPMPVRKSYRKRCKRARAARAVRRQAVRCPPAGTAAG